MLILKMIKTNKKKNNNTGSRYHLIKHLMNKWTMQFESYCNGENMCQVVFLVLSLHNADFLVWPYAAFIWSTRRQTLSLEPRYYYGG